MVARKPKAIDISNVPELLRIVDEVRTSQEPRVLRCESEDVAVITPLRPRRGARFKGKPVTDDDSLWNIVGIGRSKGPTDVSKNKHKYLAEAYAPKEV